MLNMATLKGVKKPAVVERRETRHHLKTGIMVHIFRRTIVEDIHSVAHMKKARESSNTGSPSHVKWV